VNDNFYITGSATGGIPELTLADCAMGSISVPPTRARERATLLSSARK